jgi:streptogramin lyase
MLTLRLNFLFAAVSVAAVLAPSAAVGLHVVPLPVKSPRLLGMSMDDDGRIWLGSTHRVVYRYDPRTGATDEIKLPYDSSTSQAICVGRKVYLLGQSYPAAHRV